MDGIPRILHSVGCKEMDVYKEEPGHAEVKFFSDKTFLLYFHLPFPVFLFSSSSSSFIKSIRNSHNSQQISPRFAANVSNAVRQQAT